jgi:hypothetical protein
VQWIDIPHSNVHDPHVHGHEAQKGGLVPQNRGANTDPEVRSAIEDLAMAGFKSPAIQAKLLRDPQLSKRVPASLRTIQSIAARAKRRAGELWHLERTTAMDAAFVLPVLAAMIEFSHGRIDALTTDEAAAAATILRAAPDIPPGEARRLTWMLVASSGDMVVADNVEGADVPARLHDQRRRAVEHFLAFAPWRSEEHASQYETAWRSGWIDGYLWPAVILTSLRSPEASAELRTAREKETP